MINRKNNINGQFSNRDDQRWSNSSSNNNNIGFNNLIRTGGTEQSTADRTSNLSDSYYPENNSMPSLPPKSSDRLSKEKKDSFKMPFDFSSLIQPPPPQQPPQPATQRQPSCKALYDFEAENNEELEFKEGDIIKLLARLDDNWLQGELNNRQGRFPTSYVDIIIPLP